DPRDHASQAGPVAPFGRLLAGRASPTGTRSASGRRGPAATPGWQLHGRPPAGGRPVSIGVTRSVALRGISGRVVDIECHSGQGLPAVEIGGLPDTALRQAPQRVRAAAIAADFSLNQRQLTINLSPASIPKHGTSFDLGIAVAALAACDVLP